MQYCNDRYLAAKGYRKLALEKHNYVLLYQVRNDIVFVNGIFHMLENYRDKLWRRLADLAGKNLGQFNCYL